MSLQIRLIQPDEASIWDAYVQTHPQATLYHLYAWKNVIERAYGNKSYYFIAIETEKCGIVNNADNLEENEKAITPVDLTKTIDRPRLRNTRYQVVGVLPLIHLKHFLFGNRLISIPYFDLGGILTDNYKIEYELLLAAFELAKKLNASNIEFRQSQPIRDINESKLNTFVNSAPRNCSITCATKTHKVRMLMRLPNSSEELMKAFKSKLRSQIKKSLKEGLKPKIGGFELIDDFYEVFAVNMRDLGSPVHSKKLIRNVLDNFPQRARIIIVYAGKKPIAGSILIAFRDIAENPWSSALRSYNRQSPNMLLYWTMLEYASDTGRNWFDFGRSTIGGGTYRFKKQWGATPQPLNWFYIFCGNSNFEGSVSENSVYENAVRLWKHLPVSATRVIGPMIRKHIGL